LVFKNIGKDIVFSFSTKGNIFFFIILFNFAKKFQNYEEI